MLAQIDVKGRILGIFLEPSICKYARLRLVSHLEQRAVVAHCDDGKGLPPERLTVGIRRFRPLLLCGEHFRLERIAQSAIGVLLLLFASLCNRVLGTAGEEIDLREVRPGHRVVGLDPERRLQ